MTKAEARIPTPAAAGQGLSDWQRRDQQAPEQAQLLLFEQTKVSSCAEFCIFANVRQVIVRQIRHRGLPGATPGHSRDGKTGIPPRWAIVLVAPRCFPSRVFVRAAITNLRAYPRASCCIPTANPEFQPHTDFATGLFFFGCALVLLCFPGSTPAFNGNPCLGTAFWPDLADGTHGLSKLVAWGGAYRRLAAMSPRLRDPLGDQVQTACRTCPEYAVRSGE